MLSSKATLFGKFILLDLNKHLLKEDNLKYNSSSITSLSRPQSSVSKLNSITPTLMKMETFVLIWLKPAPKNGLQLKEWPKSWRKLYHYWWPQIWTHQLIIKQPKITKMEPGLIKLNKPPNNMPNDV